MRELPTYTPDFEEYIRQGELGNDYYGYVRCSKEFTTSFEEHIQRHKANVGINVGNVTVNVTENTRNVTENVIENVGINSADVRKSTLKGTLKSTLKGTRKSIVDIIAQDPNVTIPQFAEKLGKHVRGIAKHFGNLQAEGYIRRVGADKGGHWEVLPPQVPPQVPPQAPPQVH